MEQYLASAPDPAVAEVLWILDCFASGDRDCWDRIAMAESKLRPGRMVLLMTTGDTMVWQPYVDYPDLYAVFYIGPASPFV